MSIQAGRCKAPKTRISTSIRFPASMLAVKPIPTITIGTLRTARPAETGHTSGAGIWDGVRIRALGVHFRARLRLTGLPTDRGGPLALPSRALHLFLPEPTRGGLERNHVQDASSRARSDGCWRRCFTDQPGTALGRQGPRPHHKEGYCMRMSASSRANSGLVSRSCPRMWKPSELSGGPFCMFRSRLLCEVLNPP